MHVLEQHREVGAESRAVWPREARGDSVGAEERAERGRGGGTYIIVRLRRRGGRVGEV